MSQYLSNLKQKPDHHKRRFALMVSGIFTLAIFGLWSLAHVGSLHPVVAEGQGTEVSAPSPLSALWSGTATAFKAIVGYSEEAPAELEQVEPQTE